jgi:hypothetical protein
MWFGPAFFVFCTLSNRLKIQIQIFRRSSRRKTGATVRFAELGLDQNEVVHFQTLSSSANERPNNLKSSIAPPCEQCCHRNRGHLRQKFQDCSSAELFLNSRALNVSISNLRFLDNAALQPQEHPVG